MAVVISLVCGVTGDELLRSIVETRVHLDLSRVAVDFPWITFGTVILTAVRFCVAARLLPAVRASRLDPVGAMWWL